MKGPPPRLLDDPEAAPELRADLRRTSTAAPVAYDSAAGLASLQAALALPPAPGTESALQHAGDAVHAGRSALGTGAGLGAGKLALGVLGAVLIASAGTIAWRSNARQEPVPRSAATAAHANELRANELRAPKIAAPVLPEPPAATTVTPTQPTAPTAVPADRPLADPDGKLRREIAQLARIKSLLPDQAADAYRLAQAGNREFARGMLAQEREGLAVLALAQLGREREAAARAQRFLVRYPTSPLRERIAPIAGGSTP